MAAYAKEAEARGLKAIIAGASNDGFQSARFRFLGISRHAVRCAMRRYNAALMANSQRVERLCCRAHGRPIGLAAHNDADRNFASIRHGRAELLTKRRSIGGKRAKESAVLTLVNHSLVIINAVLRGPWVI